MYGKQSVVQVLLGEGATVNQLGGEVSFFFKTALDACLYNCRHYVVKR